MRGNGAAELYTSKRRGGGHKLPQRDRGTRPGIADGGFPLNISSGEDNSLTGIGNDNADVISKPGYTSGSRADRIRSNREGTFGTAGRNILRGPGTFSLSAAAHKTFQQADHLRLQNRAEFFNASNHTNLNNPSATVTTGSFGRITSAGEPRIIQMALESNW